MGQCSIAIDDANTTPLQSGRQDVYMTPCVKHLQLGGL